jgi:hypothetical protein
MTELSFLFCPQFLAIQSLRIMNSFFLEQQTSLQQSCNIGGPGFLFRLSFPSATAM